MAALVHGPGVAPNLGTRPTAYETGSVLHLAKRSWRED